MKHKILWLFFSLTFAATQAHACDFCGCVSSGSLFGVFPHQRTNFLGLQSQYLAFRYQDQPGIETMDRFLQFNIQARYYPTKRLETFALLPYNLGFRQSESEELQLNGFGDMLVQLSYLFLKAEDFEEKSTRHSLQAGAAIKLPTGSNQFSNLNDSPLPANFQLGTGSVDYLLRVQYSLQKKNWGFSSDILYRFNTQNNANYQYGNQFAATLYGFSLLKAGSVRFMPFVGTYIEGIAQDQDEGVLQPHTGGAGLYGLIGIESFFSNFSLGINYRNPLTQNYGEGEITALSRASISFKFLF